MQFSENFMFVHKTIDIIGHSRFKNKLASLYDTDFVKLKSKMTAWALCLPCNKNQIAAEYDFLRFCPKQ